MKANKLEKKTNLDKLKKEIYNSNKLPLRKERIKKEYIPVAGEGNVLAEVMFIGEAPGLQEAITGRPFLGRAGKILDSLFYENSICRNDVYITNLIKDRPPKNREPLSHEIKAYSQILDKEIKIIQPKLIITLGRHSMKYIMSRFGLNKNISSIGKIHGQIFATSIFENRTLIIPFYHPASVIYNKKLLKDLRDDFKLINIFKNG